jgi:hypothetical protein
MKYGFTNYFIYDSYAPILVIVICYILLIISICLGRRWKSLILLKSFFYTFIYRLHEISIIYITLSFIQ